MTQLEGKIGATWAGGFDGMMVTNILLESVPVSTVCCFSVGPYISL